MISPNGIAHIQLTVRDVGASRPFYHRMLVETFGMSIQHDVPNQIFYCIGARTGVLIRPAAPEHRDTPFAQWRVGLHHFCFRLRSREDVDALHTSMRDFGAKIIRAPEDGPWAPGYYSTLFEDTRRHPHRRPLHPWQRQSRSHQGRPDRARGLTLSRDSEPRPAKQFRADIRGRDLRKPAFVPLTDVRAVPTQTMPVELAKTPNDFFASRHRLAATMRGAAM